jgi:hypothetical protein
MVVVVSLLREGLVAVASAAEVFDGRSGLDIACLDRIYLNGYVPNLQVGPQVVIYMRRHLGLPVPSPAVMEKKGTAFREAVKAFAEANGVPVIAFGKADRKIDVVQPLIEEAARAGVSKVVAVGVAQEFANVYASSKKDRPGNAPWFSFHKADRRVTCYYFYVWDADFGGGFVKVCSYFPYPMKIWVNGHEWAKRQALEAGIGFEALSNGFFSCDDPAALQAVCDRLGPGDIQAFAERWWARLPLPLDRADRDAGYWWELSMRQIEVSRTIAFTAPRFARSFFDALVTDNLTVGRADQLEIIFGRRINGGRKRPTVTDTKTKVVHDGDMVTLNAYYKHSRVKQYFKDGRALRIETVVNSPTDFAVKRRLEHLPELAAKARAVNDRLLDTETAGQDCVLAAPAFERIASPTQGEAGRAPALRFGDPRVQALASVLLTLLFTVAGITNKSLRAGVTAILGVPHTTSQATYDLRRLRLKGLIQRRTRTNTYDLTEDGRRFALFYTKVHNKVLAPLMDGDHPPAPPDLTNALNTIDQHIDAYIDRARLAA